MVLPGTLSQALCEWCLGKAPSYSLQLDVFGLEIHALSHKKRDSSVWQGINEPLRYMVHAGSTFGLHVI